MISFVGTASGKALRAQAASFVPATVSDVRPPAPSLAPVYYERLLDGQYIFYLNKHYYLTDKSCAYTVIERIARFDPATEQLEGTFHDYSREGALLLTGSYRNGQKEGVFQGYHPNGMPKWKGAFAHNLPEGDWHYYYPDGQPMLHLNYGSDSSMRILNYWDRRGRQRVTQGNGTYEMKVEVDGYSEFGAVFINRRGRLRDGRPSGVWTVEMVYEDGRSDELGTERYQHGRAVPDTDDYLDRILRGDIRHALVPRPWFTRAEELIPCPCTIDHQSGFATYLAGHLNGWFDDYLDEAILPQQVVYRISVQPDGSVGDIIPEETFEIERAAQELKDALDAVGFWFPSYLDGDYIEDELTLRLRVFPDRERHKLLFFDVDIERAQGF